MDFIGVTRTIDQAVYMLLNALAIVLWRIDSAIIGMSLYSYATQDWLTGNGGGVWYIMDWLLDTSGLFGLNTWTLFASLALMLWGLARIARPFIPSSPVHPGKLLVFFVLTYVVISQGSSLMQDIESWRLDAGSAVYQSIASSADANVDVPSVPSTSDPLTPPSDLDGQSPIRGWEAVATSYFLAANAEDIHQPYPPEAFLVAYCLYNPDLPIEDQTIENAQGCSPRNAWDEWDVIDLSILQDVLGINIDEAETAIEEFLGVLLGDIDLELTAPVPAIQHHPENRELGIRQAQAGVARLALGVVVTLFPIIEANISLMLALAASFIYLTLPIILLFGFFLATESMTLRLLMQFVYVIIRTLIINGIVALFMLLLMNTALSGSLTAYLGLIGVGLVGGFFLARIAAATMKETLGQSLGALGAIWMGTSTGLLGNAAAQPARATMGLAKMGAAAALLGVGGAMSAFDLAETSYEGVRAGAKDLRQGAPGTMNYLDRQTARLPASLARLTGAAMGSEESGVQGAQPTDMMTSLATTLAAPLAIGALATTASSKNQVEQTEVNGHTAGRPDISNRMGRRWQATATPSLATLPLTSANTSTLARQQRQDDIDRWVEQMYRARQTQRGQKQANERGRDLFGEELAWKAGRALSRHSPSDVNTALGAARQVANEYDRSELIQNGRLTGQALTAVRDKLDEETGQAFGGQKGTWDLAALSAVALQQQATVTPDEFRQALANAGSGWGKDSPGHQVPRRLGLDPVAAGAYYTALNRFTRLSEEAGLTSGQRERLLAEAQQSQISAETRAEIEGSLQKQRQQGRGLGLMTETMIASALAMPATLSGPEQVWTTPEKAQPQPEQVSSRARNEPGKSSAQKTRIRPGQEIDPLKPDQAVETQKEKRVMPHLVKGQVDRQLHSAGQPRQLGQALKSSLQDQSPNQKASAAPAQTQLAEPKEIQSLGQVMGGQADQQSRSKDSQVTPPSLTGQHLTNLGRQTEPGGGQAGDVAEDTPPIAGGYTTSPINPHVESEPQPPAQPHLGQALKSSLETPEPGRAETAPDPSDSQPVNRLAPANNPAVETSETTVLDQAANATLGNLDQPEMTAEKTPVIPNHPPGLDMVTEPPLSQPIDSGQTQGSGDPEPSPQSLVTPAHHRATPGQSPPIGRPIDAPVGRAEPTMGSLVETAAPPGAYQTAAPPIVPEVVGASPDTSQVNFGQELRASLQELLQAETNPDPSAAAHVASIGPSPTVDIEITPPASLPATEWSSDVAPRTNPPAPQSAYTPTAPLPGVQPVTTMTNSPAPSERSGIPATPSFTAQPAPSNMPAAVPPSTGQPIQHPERHPKSAAHYSRSPIQAEVPVPGQIARPGPAVQPGFAQHPVAGLSSKTTRSVKPEPMAKLPLKSAAENVSTPPMTDTKPAENADRKKPGKPNQRQPVQPNRREGDKS